jgi:hypothetical protein
MLTSQQTMDTPGFVERHIVADVPPHLADLFEHSESTFTGRLCAAALMLASTNIVVSLVKAILGL